MNPLSNRLGFWSALLSAATFIVFTLCFVAISLSNPPFIWTDLSGYVEAVGSTNQVFKSVAQLMMLVFAPLFLVLLASIEDYASHEKKILVRIAVQMGTVFVALSGIHYFLQLSIVRQNIARGDWVGLEHWIMANPRAAILAINMLGWTLFFGLASLLVAPVFTGNGLEKVIRYAFLVNGSFCLLGGIGFLFELTGLVFFTMNLGMGAAVMVAMIALVVLFRRLGRDQPLQG